MFIICTSLNAATILFFIVCVTMLCQQKREIRRNRSAVFISSKFSVYVFVTCIRLNILHRHYAGSTVMWKNRRKLKGTHGYNTAKFITYASVNVATALCFAVMLFKLLS